LPTNENNRKEKRGNRNMYRRDDGRNEGILAGSREGNSN
jgi:hypothetical protein